MPDRVTSSSSSRVPAPAVWRVVALALRVGAALDPHALLVAGLVRRDDGLVIEMPPFAALRRARRLGAVGAGRADRRERVAARDGHMRGMAGVQVGAAELDRWAA